MTYGGGEERIVGAAGVIEQGGAWSEVGGGGEKIFSARALSADMIFVCVNLGRGRAEPFNATCFGR